jgi:probable rRNA maturation factor
MPGAIQFFKADVAFRFSGKANISKWILKVVKQESGNIANLSVVFCSDEYLLNINRQYLKHDYYTDIITFDTSDRGSVSGELYISIDRVKDNASELDIPFERELKRVIIHGVLHLLGYKDKTTSQQKSIRKREDEALGMIE